jgi:hypothetical protein
MIGLGSDARNSAVTTSPLDLGVSHDRLGHLVGRSRTNRRVGVTRRHSAAYQRPRVLITHRFHYCERLTRLVGRSARLLAYVDGMQQVCDRSSA